MSREEFNFAAIESMPECELVYSICKSNQLIHWTHFAHELKERFGVN